MFAAAKISFDTESRDDSSPVLLYKLFGLMQFILVGKHRPIKDSFALINAKRDEGGAYLGSVTKKKC